MRINLLWLTAALLVVGDVDAAPIVIDYGIVELRRDLSHPMPELPLPLTISYFVRPDTPPSPITTWNVEVTPSDAGQSWTLLENTAEPTRWAAFEAAFALTHRWRFRSAIGDPTMGVPSGGSTQLPMPSPTERYRINDLESIQLTLHELFVSPIGSIVRWQHVIRGDGEIVPVPEPATALLGLATLMALVYKSRSYSQGATSRDQGPAFAHV